MMGRRKAPVHRRLGRLRARWRRRGDSGVAAVEFALTLPILAAFLYGIVELSHYIFTDIALADAARDGVRYAVVRGSSSPQPASGSDITAYVRGRLSMLNPAQATVTVTFNPNNNPGSTVKVSVAYPFTPLMPGFGYIGASTLTGASQMVIAQ